MNFSDQIIRWYAKNKRKLPWRNTSDPYKIWISEIILQQTRVDQGLPYYRRFITELPNIVSLSRASERTVLRLWQGLGYYSRARNLHSCAKYLVKHNSSRFPKTYEEIIKLKGIGPYTAAAISSFSFGLPHPVIDGNVYRVLSRFFAEPADPKTSKGKKRFEHLANRVFNPKKAAIHNQAIMEFGALQCVPQRPDCPTCVLKKECRAFKQNKVESFPNSSSKVKLKTRYFNYFIIQNHKGILIERRTEKDIWKGLYQLPLIESKVEWRDLKEIGLSTDSYHKEQLLKPHLLSHQRIICSFWTIKGDFTPFYKQKSMYVPVNKIFTYPFPKPISDYIFKNLDKKTG